jgi:hypothetical protein
VSEVQDGPLVKFLLNGPELFASEDQGGPLGKFLRGALEAGIGVVGLAAAFFENVAGEL